MKGKRIKFHYKVVIYLLAGLLFGCKKEAEDVPVVVAKRYMTYKVNGLLHSCDGVDSSLDFETILIAGIKLSVSGGQIVAFPKDAVPGNYALGKNSYYYCAFASEASILYYSNAGMLKLNSVGKTYEGTFEYTAKNINNPNDSISVTEGKFGFTP